MSNPYSRSDAFDEIDDNEFNAPVIDPVTTEEATYKKRYGDLRRHNQTQINTMNARIAELEGQLKNSTSGQMQFPKTESEVDAWMKKFPDVAAIVKTIAMKEVSKAREDVDTRFSKLDERERAQAKREAQIELARLHPDFFTEIIESEDFRDWITSKSQRVQDALFVNETDVQEAADVITMYKAETGYGAPKRGRPRKEDGARDVNVRNNASVGDGSRGRTFKESEIARMNPKQYEALEEEIDNAHRNGRVIMDLSGAA